MLCTKGKCEYFIDLAFCVHRNRALPVLGLDFSAVGPVLVPAC